MFTVLLYSCTTWTLTKRFETKLDGNYTRTLHTVLNKSYRQHFTKQQLYGHLPPILETIKVPRTRHVRYSVRSKDKLLCTHSHELISVGYSLNTYIFVLCFNTGCRLENVIADDDDDDICQFILKYDISFLF